MGNIFFYILGLPTSCTTFLFSVNSPDIFSFSHLILCGRRVSTECIHSPLPVANSWVNCSKIARYLHQFTGYCQYILICHYYYYVVLIWRFVCKFKAIYRGLISGQLKSIVQQSYKYKYFFIMRPHF